MSWRMREPSSPRRKDEPLHVEVAQLGAEARFRGEVGIGDFLLRGRERVPQRPRAGEPQADRDRKRVVEPWVALLDLRAERFELLRPGRDCGGDFGMDLRVAECWREQHPKSVDARVEVREVVGVIRRKRRPVPRVGSLEHVHHERRVRDAHRVRAEV